MITYANVPAGIPANVFDLVLVDLDTGKAVDDCFEASTAEGWARVYARDAKGLLLWDATRESVEEKTIYGNFKIIRKDEPRTGRRRTRTKLQKIIDRHSAAIDQKIQKLCRECFAPSLSTFDLTGGLCTGPGYLTEGDLHFFGDAMDVYTPPGSVRRANYCGRDTGLCEAG